MPYNYPVKPWFNIASTPKCLFWPVLIGSIVFWFFASLIRATGKMLLDILGFIPEHYESCCCFLNFIATLPLLLLAVSVTWPFGIWYWLKPDLMDLKDDAARCIQWNKSR